MTFKGIRSLRLAAGSLAALLVLGLGIACVLYPPAYVWRVFVWQDADVGDQERFAKRMVRAAPGAADLPVATEAARVEMAFSRALPGETMDAWLAARGTQGFVVLQRGRILYEGYFNGQRRDEPATSFSVAKSILGALVDAAMEDGHIASLHEPVTKHIPELRQRDLRFDQITLRHLVDMNSGIRYREFPFLHGDDAKTYYHPNLRALALNETVVERAPGQQWLYNNYHPLLIGLVLERSTGVPVAKWLEQRLWQPAGMAADASWSLDSENGFEKLESGINARTLDFARFGQLFLDGGVALDGRQVLSAAAVRAATGPEGAWPLDRLRPGMYYKHFWWGQKRADGNYDYSARGNYGQFVFVSPANGVVIARNGREYGVAAAQWMKLFEQMADALGAAPAAQEASTPPPPSKK